MKKHPLPTWLGCLLMVALSIVGTWHFWSPITEASGTHYDLRLERAYFSGSTLWLDFGKDDDFRLPYADMDSELLRDSAVGQEYHIIADYHARRRGSDYYDVYALSGADGTAYLTISQSEAQRRGMLPLRITLFVLLDALICGLLIWADRRHKAAQQALDAIPDEPDTEEESP